MQYLKDEVKNNILASALKEFSEKGFIDASIRNIASNAGVAIGNLYRYFKNKEDLFNNIIDPLYDRIWSYLLDIKNYESCDQTPIDALNDVKDRLVGIFKVYSKEFVILMDKSKGTKYENIRQELIEYIDTILEDNLFAVIKKKGVKITDEAIGFVLSSTIVEGFCVIIRSYDDIEKIDYLIRQLIIINFLDIQSRLQ